MNKKLVCSNGSPMIFKLELIRSHLCLWNNITRVSWVHYFLFCI